MKKGGGGTNFQQQVFAVAYSSVVELSVIDNEENCLAMGLTTCKRKFVGTSRVLAGLESRAAEPCSCKPVTRGQCLNRLLGISFDEHLGFMFIFVGI